MEIQRLALLLVITMYLFSPAIMEWWMNAPQGWYAPWLLWFVVVIVACCLQRWRPPG